MTDAPQQDAGTEAPEIPQPRSAQPETAPAPKVTVLGYMDSQIAVRLGWKPGMLAISQSRFRFLRDDLGMDVTDDPAHYLF